VCAAKGEKGVFITLSVPCYECSDDAVDVLYYGDDIEKALSAAVRERDVSQDVIEGETDRDAETIILNFRGEGWSTQVIRLCDCFHSQREHL
jgi:hypothetical protein